MRALIPYITAPVIGLAIGGLATLAGCSPSTPENAAKIKAASRADAQYMVDNLHHIRDAQGRCYAVLGSGPQYAVLTWEPCQ